MALVALEGFELERTAIYLEAKYGTGVIGWASAAGLMGGQAIRGGNSTAFFTIHSQGTQENSWVVGLNIRARQITFPDAAVRFRTGGNVQWTMTFDADPASTGLDTQIQLTDGTTVYTVPFRLLDNVWYYVELVVTIRDGVNGSFEVWIDGVQRMTQSGIDTAQQGTDGADEVQIGISTKYDLDNIYVLTGTGTPNTRQGPIHVVGLLPNADSSFENEWEAVGGGSKFTKVDDSPALSFFDSDRITADAANMEQLFPFQDLTAGLPVPRSGVSILGIEVGCWGAMDGSGTRNVAVRFKDVSSGTPVNGASTWSVVGTSQQYHSQLWQTNPVTASAFTDTEINAMEVGVATLT